MSRCFTLFLVVLLSCAPADLPSQNTTHDDASANSTDRLLQLGSRHQEEAPELDLEHMEKDFGKAVVKIMFTPIQNMYEIKRDPRLQENYGGQWGSNDGAHGSGFFINTQGYIVTNAHVVENANRHTIRCQSPLTGNTKFELELVGVGNTDMIDIALLRLKEKEIPRFKKLAGCSDLPFLKIANSDMASNTEKIVVMGFPEDSDDMRVKAAQLSGRQYLEGWDDLLGGFQFLEVATASAVKSGNSGGAALNLFGELIGIPARGDWTDSVGWLIPSNVLVHYIDQLKVNRQGVRKMEILSLGIAKQKTFPGMAALMQLPEDVIDHEIGMSINRVNRNSLAEKWGLRAGDIILSFRNVERDICVYLDYEGRVKTTGKMSVITRGSKTYNNEDAPRRYLSELVLMSRPGQTIELEYAREGEGVKMLSKTLAFVDRDAGLPHLGPFEVPDYVEWGGMILQNLHDNNCSAWEMTVYPQLITEGAVRVTFIDSGSLAAEREMDAVTITHLNGRRVHSLDEFRDLLKEIGQKHDAWQKEDGFKADKALYDARNYVRVTHTSWDGETQKLIESHVTFPIEEASRSGRSLTSVDK